MAGWATLAAAAGAPRSQEEPADPAAQTQEQKAEPAAAGSQEAAPLPSTQPAPAPAAPGAPATQPAGPPTHEATDFRLTLTRGGKDLFTLRARRSAGFGSSHTNLEEVTLTARAGPAPGLEVRARRATYLPPSGDFTLTGEVVIGRRGDLQARVDTLVYSAADGLARSQDPVSLSGPRLSGAAQGLEVSPTESRLALGGGVRLHHAPSDEAGEPLDLECGTLDYFLSPPRAQCREGARALSGKRILQARAIEVDLREPDRRPLAARASGQARLAFDLEAQTNSGLPGWGGFPGGTALVLSAERIDLDLDPEHGGPRAVQAPSAGVLEGSPLAGGGGTWRLKASFLMLSLRPRAAGPGSMPEALAARGDVRLEWPAAGAGASGPAGALETADLEVRWAADGSEITSARLRGGWRLEEPDLRGAGSEADLDPRIILLRGGAEGYATLERAGRLLAGARLTLPRAGAGAWSGEGGVQARRGANGDGAWMPLGGSEAFWVSAERFEVDPQSWRWRFEGGARAWQGASLIEAERLEVDETARTLAARGSVVTRAAGAQGPNGSGADTVIGVRAPRLDYREAERRAEYRDGVELIHDTSHLAALEVDVWLTGAEGRVERVSARGDVRVTYQDAVAESQRAEYSPAGRRMRLWTPGGLARARRRDGSQALSGSELTFEGSSEKIAVQSGERGRSWVVFKDDP